MPPHDAATKIYLLIGNPVAHSLSPAMHNSAFEAAGINAVYLACPVEEHLIVTAAEGLKALAIAGANITSPYKETIISCLDSLSKESALLRSVNTVINRDGKLHGETTDGEGLFRALEEALPGGVMGRKVAIIGAGGAARSAAYTLAKQGISKVTLLNRTAEKARALVAIISSACPGLNCSYLPLTRESIARSITEADIILYTLPLDLKDFIDTLCGDFIINRDCLLVDFRYHPFQTAVMDAFEKKGGRAVNGLGMLFWQAVLSFEIFCGHKAPLEVMRRAAGI